MKSLCSFRLDAKSRLRSTLRLAITLTFAALVAFAGPVVSAAHATGVYDFDPVHAGDSTWVVDQAEVLSRFKQGQVSSRLEQIRDNTGAEVRFVVFRRLDYGETIESLTSDLFKTWFPDDDAAQNQVLIGVDTVTNTTGIQVGPGLSGDLTDSIATSVIEETMMAPIRKGDQYNQALMDASDRLAVVLAGEEDPGPPVVEDRLNVERTFASKEETEESNATVIVIVLLIVATVVPMLTYFAYVR